MGKRRAGQPMYASEMGNDQPQERVLQKRCCGISGLGLSLEGGGHGAYCQRAGDWQKIKRNKEKDGLPEK